MIFLKKILNSFTGKKEDPISSHSFSQEESDLAHELKEQGLERVLGKMHNIVGHAIIPFEVGGAVDMYYFNDHIEGTGFATMELLDPNGNGPKPNRFGTYELVAFTKLPYNSNDKDDTYTPFDTIERRICGTFTSIGSYSFQAVLNPNDTIEIPRQDEESRFMVFDNYLPDGKEFTIGNKKHHLLLCIEIFKSELEFARMNSSVDLLELLKQEKHYPYSDLNRKPVR
jgi:hypothetical protein